MLYGGVCVWMCTIVYIYIKGGQIFGPNVPKVFKSLQKMVQTTKSTKKHRKTSKNKTKSVNKLLSNVNKVLIPPIYSSVEMSL